MKTLVIYDTTGVVITTQGGESTPTPRQPVGIPYLWVEIPQGKYVVSVDISTTPHKPVFEDLPLSEIDQLRLEQAQANSELVQLIMLMSGGMAQ